MKCTNEFTCYDCKKNYHRNRPLSEALLEHEERKKKIKGYDQGEAVIEVCDDCFRKVMQRKNLKILANHK